MPQISRGRVYGPFGAAGHTQSLDDPVYYVTVKDVAVGLRMWQVLRRPVSEDACGGSERASSTSRRVYGVRAPYQTEARAASQSMADVKDYLHFRYCSNVTRRCWMAQ